MEEGEITSECTVQAGFLETGSEERGRVFTWRQWNQKTEAWSEEATGVFGSSGSPCSTLAPLTRVGAGGRQERQAEIRLCRFPKQCKVVWVHYKI